MRSITYVSTAVDADAWTRPALLELVRTSREHNAARELTGMLLYRRGRFIQVLEGEDDQLSAAFDMILDDERHEDVFVVVNEVVEQRLFGDWSMGFRHVDDLPARDLAGLTPFLDEDRPAVADGGTSVSLRLLELFRASGI